MLRVLILPILFSTIAAANADDATLPPRRPGLWERSTPGGGDAARTSKACVDQASDKALFKQAEDGVKRVGGTMTVTGSGNHYRVVTVATMRGHTMTSVNDMTFIGDTDVEMRARTTIDPPFDKAEGNGTVDVVTSSKWIGACPPDLRPGQIQLNGRTIDILEPPPKAP